jgi:hypothetical protein
LGQIVLPIAIDMLNLERHVARERVFLVPAAALTLSADDLYDVTAQGLVEVGSRRQSTDLPQSEKMLSMMFALAAQRTVCQAVGFDSPTATAHTRRAQLRYVRHRA